MKVDTLTGKRARALRRDLTDPERILWSKLQRNQLGWHFRDQHPVPPYTLDFACVRFRLAIEIDGATHSTEDERRHDAVRTAALERQGWTVLRFWNSDVYENLEGVLRVIADALPPPTRVRRGRG